MAIRTAYRCPKCEGNTNLTTLFENELHTISGAIGLRDIKEIIKE